MKVKKVILIICIVIILCALIEIVTKGLITSTQDFIETKREEKREEELYNSPIEVVKRNSEIFMEQVLEAIEKKDYDKVYDSLDKNYLDYKFQNSKENMIKYIEENFANKKLSFVYTKGNSKISTCIIGVQYGEDYTSIDMNVVNDNEDNPIAMMFEDLRAFDKVDYTSTTSVAKYNVVYSFLANKSKERISKIVITNTSNSLLSISISSVSEALNNDEINKNYVIPVGESVSFEVRMDRVTKNEAIRLVGTENDRPLDIILKYLSPDNV